MNIPEKYQTAIDAVVSTASRFLSEGRELQPMAFLGKVGVGFTPVPMNMGNKNQSAAIIKELCRSTKPDYVIMISEAWALSKKVSEEECLRIAKSGESIANHPGREDVIMITLETREGVWLAQPSIEPFNKKPRKLGDVDFKLGDVDFLFMNGAEGRFASFLPPEGLTH